MELISNFINVTQQLAFVNNKNANEHLDKKDWQP